MSASALSQVLESLLPRNAEELSLLRGLLSAAQAMQRRLYGDLGLAFFEPAKPAAVETAEDPLRFLASLPSGAKRYFDGLVEAVEIYQSIHGQALAPSRLDDRSLQELRRIRDLCLEGGLHSVY